MTVEAGVTVLYGASSTTHGRPVFDGAKAGGMLNLEDDRWKQLDHRNWSNGVRSYWDPEAPFVPDELRLLVADPHDAGRLRRLGPYLCCEGATWPAAYAATPYLVDIAARLPSSDRLEYLVLVGLIATYGSPDKAEPYLLESYQGALQKALVLLVDVMTGSHSQTDTRYLLCATAALKGHPRLAGVLEALDTLTECPGCGTQVFDLGE